MAGKTVEIEALDKAAASLREYIGEVQTNIRKMHDAAQDCADNMGNDVYSRAAISKLQDCTNNLSLTMKKANELMGKILKRKREIEESGRNIF